MGATNEFLYQPFNWFGPCIFETENVAQTAALGYSVWDEFGRSGEFSFDPETQKATRAHWIRGMLEETGERVTGMSASGSTSFMEWHPHVMQLLLGDKTSDQTKTNPRIRYEAVNKTLHRYKSTGKGIEQHLPFSSGFANQTKLPAFAALTPVVSATGTGSGWSTAGNPDYYAFAVGVFRRPGSSVTPSASTIEDSDKLDIEWVLGAPNTSGATINFTNADDIVTFAGTAHGKDAALPDYYAIYMSTTDTIVGATCVAVGACTAGAFSSVAVLTLGAASTYSAGTGIKFYTVTGDPESPTYSAALTIGTDILWDTSTFTFRLPDDTDADATSGVRIQVRYFYVEPYSVSNNIGATGVGEDYRKVRILCIEPEEQGGNPLYPAGYELILYKCNLAGLTPSMRLGSDGFYEGQPVSFKVLADPSNGNYFGTKRILSNSGLRDYTQSIV